MKVYLVRHGESILNRQQVYFGWSEAELTALGIKQAEEVGEILKNIKWAAVWASPLKRTINTTKIILEKNINQPVEAGIQTHENLKEINFGAWEGLGYELIAENYPAEWRCWANDWQGYRMPAGESFKDFSKRLALVWQQLKNSLPAKGNVLIVSHAGVLKLLWIIEHQLPVKEFWQLSFPLGSVREMNIQM